jgi:transposase InsO family protein
MCQLLGVPRSLVYRKRSERPERARFFSDLRARIVEIAGVHPGYGYRRVRLALAREGVRCSHRRTLGIMKEAGLQRRRRRPFPRTSDGRGRGFYPNRLKEAKVDTPGAAWVADLTYVGLPAGRFCYLACVLDVFTRRIVGSAMGERIDAALTLRALREALEAHPPKQGWVHHSDRGSQYLSKEYVELVRACGGLVSCSDRGSPQDNAFMESFFKTLKAEEVWLEDYESLEHADRSVGRFLDYYNSQRMHSSLGYRSPDAYEASIEENDPS